MERDTISAHLMNLFSSLGLNTYTFGAQKLGKKKKKKDNKNAENTKIGAILTAETNT